MYVALLLIIPAIVSAVSIPRRRGLLDVNLGPGGIGIGVGGIGIGIGGGDASPGPGSGEAPGPDPGPGPAPGPAPGPSISTPDADSASSSASEYSSSVSDYSASLSASASVASSLSKSASIASALSASLSTSASVFSATSLAASASRASSLSLSASAYSSSSLSLSASDASSLASSLSASASMYTATSMAASAFAASMLASSLSASSSAAAAAATVVPTNWAVASTPCIAEGTTGRALTGAELVTDDMTYPKCLNFCSSKGFSIGSITYGRECRCGDQLVNGASLSRTSKACRMKCSGSNAIICGGPNALTLFVIPSAISNLSPDLVATAPSLAPGWVGASTPCIAEGKTGRALTLKSFASDKMTPALCTAWCTAQNAQYCAASYGAECWAGTTLSNGASLSISSNACQMPCSGDGSSICGGPNALSLFVNPNYRPTGYPSTLPGGWQPAPNQCIQEVPGRALTGAFMSDPTMTVPKCLSFCQDKGFQYAGLEYGIGGECYCSVLLYNGASTELISDKCDMACLGDASSFCGGSDAIQLYVNPSLAPPTTVSNYTYTACIQEVGGRALTGASIVENDMTVDKCAAFCQEKGFQMFGLEYSSECYCGNGFSNGASLKKTTDRCIMPCSGAPTGQLCGGSNAISLWQLSRS